MRSGLIICRVGRPRPGTKVTVRKVSGLGCTSGANGETTSKSRITWKSSASAPCKLRQINEGFSPSQAAWVAAMAGDSGKNTANTVPLVPGLVRLATLIQPLCFCTIPYASHKPNPVPVSFLVV
jgi:hypothetical protein